MQTGTTPVRYRAIHAREAYAVLQRREDDGGDAADWQAHVASPSMTALSSRSCSSPLPTCVPDASVARARMQTAH